MAEAITDDVVLLVAMHPFGVPCDVERLGEVAGRAGAALVYDAAHAAGTYVGERHAAGFGTASVLSLSVAKLATAAEGALVCLSDASLARRFRHLRNYGFLDDYAARWHGLNGRMSELHAVLGSLTLPRIEELVAARGERVARYASLLAGVPGLALQAVPDTARPGFTAMAVDAGDRRDALAAHLCARGIETRPYFRPLHRMEPFSRFAAGSLPVTEHLGRSVLCLPLYHHLPLEDVDRVAAEVRRFLGAPGA